MYGLPLHTSWQDGMNAIREKLANGLEKNRCVTFK